MPTPTPTEADVKPVHADRQPALSAPSSSIRLEFLNRPTPYAHGQLCGILLSWKTPDSLKGIKVLRAEIEVRERTQDIGELQARAYFTLFATKNAYSVIKFSKPGDIIQVPHMVFKFFKPMTVGEKGYANGWICETALNMSVHNTPRFDEGRKADMQYKQERKQESELKDLELEGETPW